MPFSQKSPDHLLLTSYVQRSFAHNQGRVWDSLCPVNFFSFWPKAETGSKHIRNTNHCKSALIAKINIDAVLFFLLLCIEHTLYARPFISIISFNPLHDLWNRHHCPPPFYRVRNRHRLSNTSKAIQQTREGSVSCFMRILSSIYLTNRY